MLTQASPMPIPVDDGVREVLYVSKDSGNYELGMW